MGMLKDALGPAMGAGQANNGLNGAMSKVKGMFGQKNGTSAPENWRAPSPAPLPDLNEPRHLNTNRIGRQRDKNTDDSEDEDDLPPPYDSRREGTQLRDDRRVLAAPQAYDEYDPPSRSPRRMGGEDRTLRPRVPFEQYGPPQGQQSWGQGPGMGPPSFSQGAYGDAYGGRRPRRDRGDRIGRRDMQQGGGYGGNGGNGGYGGGGRDGGRRGNGGMGGMMSMGMYGGGGGCEGRDSGEYE